ncbi:MAG: hypothetical protein GX115_10095 [Ruminiclostridium sp.]|nr:hypothetical protein [Ruminiclostridium sp.]
MAGLKLKLADRHATWVNIKVLTNIKQRDRLVKLSPISLKDAVSAWFGNEDGKPAEAGTGH